MGTSGSRENTSSLPGLERDALTKTFRSIADDAKDIRDSDFYRLLHDKRNWNIPEATFKCMYTSLCGNTGPSAVLSLQSFLKCCGLLLGHGSPTERVQLLYSLQASLEDGKVLADSVKLTLFTYVKLLCTSPVLKDVFTHAVDWDFNENTCQQMASYLADDLQHQESPEVVTFGSFSTWLGRTPLVETLYTTVFCMMFLHGSVDMEALRSSLRFTTDAETGRKSYDTLLIPEVMRVPFHPSSQYFTSSLLDLSTIILLNSFLPGDSKGRLFPLFSSSQHGESFSTLVGRIVKQGPVLLVIRDTGGNVFGGFASQSWTISPEFTGSGSCFLFTLHPSVGVYDSTGYNTNYMYLEQNAQTLPNGLGMGGQLNYFGLWISGDYGSGHSMARPKCTTYGSPTLSSTEEFKIDCLEAWGVGDPSEPEVKEKSILDKDKTAQTILDLAGKTRHSEGLRTPVESDDDDETN